MKGNFFQYSSNNGATCTYTLVLRASGALAGYFSKSSQRNKYNAQKKYY
jgi:hypothetical protein